jgi:tetratricopeptide (TPR) repeat protein
MKRVGGGILLFAAAAILPWLRGVDSDPPDQVQIWHHRNLGKAFYENPTTQLQAVDEFRKALELAPHSARERVNYGLSLLRAGKTSEGVAELERAQQQDPLIPHTWFNIGITYKKSSQYDLAIAQFEQMVQLAPDEPVSHYNLGVLYKLAGKPEDSLRHLELSARLDPNLAGPHFQLYNAYRQAGRGEDAARELALFQEIKKRQAGAAIPEDLEWSYYSEIYDTVEPRIDSGAPGELSFKERVLPGKLDARTAGLAILDADGDGQSDLLAWSGKGIRLYRSGSTPVESGLENLRDIISIHAGDFNNDGLADLCVITAAGASLYQNFKGSFRTAPAQLPDGAFRNALWLDFDHDYDIDLFLFGTKSALVRNNGSAGFSDHSGSFPFEPGKAAAAAGLDLIADTAGKDVVVLYEDREAVLYRDRLAGKYEAVPLGMFPAGGAAVTSYDFDNDGWTDLIASYPDGVRLAVNRGGKLETVPLPDGARGPVAIADLENRALADLGAGGCRVGSRGRARLEPAAGIGFHAATASASADFDNDGREDLAFVGDDGSVRIFRNESQTAHKWLRVSLAGVRNLKLAPGAQVEVKAGPFYQKKTYQGGPLLFGLNSMDRIDTVRITWPNGLIQNQPRQSANKAELYKEAQRLSGSCPMIYTWNGKEFEFITDVLGVAPLGASSGDGGYFPVDHDEYVQISGRSLVPLEGNYEIRVTEELREVSYLDQIRLIALDHPSDVAIYTNDKFKSPPFPEFRLFGVRKRLYPQRARDHKGRDVTQRLLRRDRTYPDGFDRTYSGVAAPHHLDLDFGDVAREGRAILVLSGWVDWADGSTFLGAAQEDPRGLMLPSLQVKDAAGSWQTVIQDMGIPAGKPKTIAVDLTGTFLSESREVRIATNLCVYWDEIFLSEDTSAPQVRLTGLSPSSAELRFRGFSQPTIHPERKQPESFDYQRRMPSSMWNPTTGLYTRYGDVCRLLEHIDDQMVILGSGDEVVLSFGADRLPALSPGWTRDFLLFVDGWAKDGDANTAFSQSVTPLPFHEMSAYPYTEGERFPDDQAHRTYLMDYNTRPALRLVRPLADQRMR